jgi:molecular chaperone DnaK
MDLSIVDVSDGVFEILSTDGDLDLGGSIIDESLVNYLADEFQKSEGTDLRKDPMALQRLFEAAEKAKIELSNSTAADVNLPYITSIDGVPKHLVLSVSRAKFEQLAEPIIEKTIEKSKSALKASKLNVNDISEVLLVGGSSRIPLAQEKLEKFFGKKVSKTLNPDTCVSSGATIQGGILSGITDLLLLDVTPLSLGIETMGGVMTRLIEANTTIPTRKEQVFSTAQDNQPSVEIHILQGERPMAKDNRSLGRFFLDVVSAPRGVPQIECVMDIDSNGIVSVSAKDKATGKENKIRIEGGTQISKEEIERMKKEASENAESDRLEREKIDKLNSIDGQIFQTEKGLKEYGDKLSTEGKAQVEEALTALKTAHSSKDLEKMETEAAKLTEIWNKVVTEMYQSSQNSNGEQQGPEDVSYEEVKE